MTFKCKEKSESKFADSFFLILCSMMMMMKRRRSVGV
jgi:hypothetical protein